MADWGIDFWSASAQIAAVLALALVLETRALRHIFATWPVTRGSKISMIWLHFVSGVALTMGFILAMIVLAFGAINIAIYGFIELTSLCVGFVVAVTGPILLSILDLFPAKDPRPTP